MSRMLWKMVVLLLKKPVTLSGTSATLAVGGTATFTGNVTMAGSLAVTGTITGPRASTVVHNCTCRSHCRSHCGELRYNIHSGIYKRYAFIHSSGGGFRS